MRWIDARARAGETVSARRSRNRVSGTFLGVGAALTAIALLVVPGWHVTNRPVLIAVALALLVGSVCQVVFAGSVPIVMNHVATVAGTVAIAAAQALAGDPIAVAALGLLYVWVAICAALYYSLVAAAIHVADLVIAQVLVVVLLGRVAMVPQLVLTAGTCVTVAAVVGVLVRNLRRQVVTDPLTGLLNRRGLNRAFRFEIAVAARTRLPLSVAILDLDGFKQVNDERGHAAGDRILTDVAHAWRAALEPGGILSRLGGDEFAAVLPGCDAHRAASIMARVLDATPTGVRCSAGVAVYDGREDRHELLSRADSALYRAKADGGAKLAIDNPPLTAVA